MKIAIVHDDFIQRGGAEKLVLAMLEIWPEADLYAVVATEAWRREIKTKISKEIKTGWLQKFPFKEKLYRYYYSLYPLVLESFRFDDYDLVISSSARYAHGIITKPGTVHVAYVNSPARFLWERYLTPSNVFLRPIINWHRAWDKVAGQRPDYVIANSKTPAKRVEEYWGRKVDAVIYPFVDLERFTGDPGRERSPVFIRPIQPDCRRGRDLGEGVEGYFLVVSRLNRWKRIDLAIQAGNELRWPLVVVGQGEDEACLKGLAGPTIKFLGRVGDEELVSLYQNCRALILTQAEDFGITALEAQACGRPVVAFGKGGALETVINGVTGMYFESQTKDRLVEVLSRFDEKKYLRENCFTQARKFSQARFQKDLVGFVNNVLRKEQKNH